MMSPTKKWGQAGGRHLSLQDPMLGDTRGMLPEFWGEIIWDPDFKQIEV